MARIAVAALFCLALSAQEARANLFVNGSFESPALGTGASLELNPGDTGLTGWTIVSQVALAGPGFNCCGYSALPPSDGSNWLDMTGNVDNGTGGISQAVTLIAGHTYKLSLDVGNAYSIGDPRFSTGPSGPGATSTILTTVTGVAGGAFVVTNGVQTNAMNWETFTETFVATVDAATVTFSNGDVSGDILNGLDNVVLLDVTPATTPPATGVPEPETLPLLALGIGAFAMMAARRRGPWSSPLGRRGSGCP